MSSIVENLEQVMRQMRLAEQQSNRKPGSVKLLAVSKKHPSSAIREAFSAGQLAFGENYVQEALAKQQEVQDLPLEWHLIGPLQSNKAKEVAQQFDWLHTLDRLKLAEKLSQHRPAEVPPLNVLLQVNISQDPAKAGILPEEITSLAQQVAQLPGLQLRGLMTILALDLSPEQQRADYMKMQQHLTQLQAILPDCDTLSMGMSDDLPQAIAAGSTMVRIGTAIFGTRGI